MDNHKKYSIVGNSGLAKEILFLAIQSGWDLKNFLGFIDYKPRADVVNCLGQSFQVYHEDVFLNLNQAKDNISIFFGIGNPFLLQKAVKKYSKFIFPNLIHPSVNIHKPSINIGQAVYISAGCSLTCDISIGSFNLINLNSTIGHDTKIGNFNIINPGANISGSVSIDDANLIGTNATILQGLKIGSNNVIGASSLVTKNIGSNLVYVGIPAKPIKENK